MRAIQSGWIHKSLITLLAAAMIWTLPVAYGTSAQTSRYSGGGRIDAGTTITVRTNEDIRANDPDGRVFTGDVEQDVKNRNGDVAIRRGSNVELVVRRASDNEVAVDLDSVTVNGQRYGVETEENVLSSERREGVGANRRTGEFVGGGALLGAIIGAVAGGGKGAAIGAGAGAAAGAGAQVLTRGRTVNVPAESLLTFRLSEPLRAGAADNGFMRGGVHYHQGAVNQAADSAAYREGRRDGRADADRNLPPSAQSRRWNNAADRRDYEAGYSEGYQSDTRRSGLQKPGSSNASGNINIRGDKSVTWRGPENASVYVYVDNEPAKLFAAGRSGTLAAPWIAEGHVYVFVLRDERGNEIARDQEDLRSRRPAYRR